MSDKIINGIDVSECDYFEKQHIEDMYESDDCNVCIENFCALCWKECEKYNGCYFKQLKRLQEENEELKAIIERCIDKPKIKIIDGDIAILNIKLQQALEEIKKWATNHNPCDIEEGFNCTKEDCFDCLNYDIKKITKIINEVLNDRN